MSEIVEVALACRGRIPVDHGYALYAAVSKVVPLKERGWALLPVRGRASRGGLRLATDESAVRLRLPVLEVGDLIPLADATLEVQGQGIRLGECRVSALRPRSSLRSRFVTIAGRGQDTDDMSEAVLDQLAVMGVGGAVAVGPRRVMRVSGRVIRGYAVEVRGLGDQDSLQIQRFGIGGRRRMTAGSFY